MAVHHISCGGSFLSSYHMMSHTPPPFSSCSSFPPTQTDTQSLKMNKGSACLAVTFQLNLEEI